MYVNDIPNAMEQLIYNTTIIPSFNIGQGRSNYMANGAYIINPSKYPSKLIFNGTTTIAVWGNDYPASKTIAKCSEFDDECGLVSTGVEICIVRHILRRNFLNRLRHRNPYNWVDAAWDIVYAAKAPLK